MPNTRVPAAAEGMPIISRRAFLRSTVSAAILGGIAVMATPSAAAVHDPMLDLVRRHRAFNTRYASGCLAGDDDEVDAFYEAHLSSIREAIAFEPPPVTTEEGAREAIREALGEFTICDQFTKSLLLGALAFLDGSAAR